MNMNPQGLTGGRLLRLGSLFLALLFLWVMVGPKQFGGSVSYVITQGNSMEPVFQEGDLVITRETADYAVGDIIAAFDKRLNATVLHRVIEERDGRYVTKGDNNDFIDEYEPHAEDIMGEKWLHISGGGTFLRRVLTPFGTSVLIGLLSFIVIRSRRGERDIPDTGPTIEFEPARRLLETPTQQLRWFALPIALALAYFFALGFFAFTRPASESITSDAAYEHTGRFSYSGKTEKSSLYPKGRLRSGDVIHSDQVREVTFSFTDAITSEEPIAMAGEAQLTAKLSTDVGWSRTFTLEETSWTDEVTLSGNLDVRSLTRLATKVATETGLAGSFLLEIQARVEPQGFIAGEPVEQPFVATVPFQIAGNILQPVPHAEEGKSILRPSMPGTVEITRPVAKTVDLLGMQLPVEKARRTSLLGGLVALALAAGFGVLYKRKVDGETESERILARYGEWLVPVTTLESLEGMPSVPTSDIEGLIRMADRQGRMALYVVDKPDVFFFEQHGIVYFFATDEGTAHEATSRTNPVAALVPPREEPPAEKTKPERAPAGSLPERASDDQKKKVRPRKFSIATLEEAEKVAVAYKSGRTVTVDLTEATPAAAKRITDFVSGLVYATGGRLQRDERRVVTLVPPAEVTDLIAPVPTEQPSKKSSPRKKSG